MLRLFCLALASSSAAFVGATNVPVYDRVACRPAEAHFCVVSVRPLGFASHIAHTDVSYVLPFPLFGLATVLSLVFPLVHVSPFSSVPKCPSVPGILDQIFITRWLVILFTFIFVFCFPVSLFVSPTLHRSVSPFSSTLFLPPSLCLVRSVWSTV